MDLQTHLIHLRNKRIQIGQVHYDIDATGVIRNLPAEDATHLLSHAHGAWQQVHPTQAKGAPAPRRRTPFKAHFKPADPTEAPMDLGATPAGDTPLLPQGPYTADVPAPPDAIDPGDMGDEGDGHDDVEDLEVAASADTPFAQPDPNKPKRHRRRK